MKALGDSAAFDWIRGGRTETPHSSRVNENAGVEVSCLMPRDFQRYAKILHRLDGHYENIDSPLSREENAILGISDCTGVRDLVTGKRSTSKDSRILWREAAEALGVPYAPGMTHAWFSLRLRPNPECWPRFIWGPEDGSLDTRECCALASLLGEATSSQDCYFRLAEIPFVGTDQKLLFMGRLNEITDYFPGGQGISIYGRPFQFTPEYWWPLDHSWCVCSDYDLTFTVVGGPSPLIDALLRHPFLECIEVTPQTRVDDLTPMPPEA